MIIANPIYDVVFKRLMEDQRVAKFFIETLIEETIEEVRVLPQEYTFVKPKKEDLPLSIFRLDFIATIKVPGGYKKVLIEIQKARTEIDLMRFRNYLGEQYKKEEETETEAGKDSSALPIITIYLLGFSLPGLDCAAIKVNRNYVNLFTHEVIHAKSDFIEKLTHDCYVVQLPRINGKIQTRLEKLLSLFEQNYFIDKYGAVKDYTHEIDDEIIKKMVQILNHAGTTPEGKKAIENEQEAWRVYLLETKKMRMELAKKNKIIEEKDKVIEAKDSLIEELKRQLEESKRSKN